MSISTLESPASVRALDEATRYSDALTVAECSLAADFMAAARAGNMEAVATFAPRTTDWAKRQATGDKSAKRPQLVGEVLFDSLSRGVDAQVMGLLCAVARGEDQSVMAQLLLTTMAHAWAAQNCVVDQ